jgi:hypothetical protein
MSNASMFKFFIGAVFLLSSTTVEAAPAASCAEQNACLVFTMEPVGGAAKCGAGQCDYKVCAKIDEKKAGCAKTDAWSHTCRKKPLSNQCVNPTGFAKTVADETANPGNGYTECQIVSAGSIAQFLFKDGKTCSGSASVQIGSGVSASCAPRDAATSSCTGNGVGVECVWKVTAPSTCPTPAVAPVPATNERAPIPAPTSVALPPISGGGGGDPHFRTYDGTMYSYHGECDLVMARSTTFDNGTGMDIHARTAMVNGAWSLISNAAIRIGSDILEINNAGESYLNHGTRTQFPLMMAGKFFVTKDVPNDEAQNGERLRFFIDLNSRSDSYPSNSANRIVITLFRKMISVRVDAYIQDTEGMLGMHDNNGMIGRDHSTVFQNENDMGSEWQVTDNELMLFQDRRYPQYPEKCILPAIIAETSRRRLRSTSVVSIEQAQDACAASSKQLYQFCIEDVLRTGDILIANGYSF